MKFLSLLVSVIAVVSNVRGDDEAEEAVFTLTSENFNSFIAENSKVLVEFYAPWCGHCKKLAPEYEKAAQLLKADENIDTVLAKVDATEEKDLASKYGVRGFPTLKYFTGDVENPSDYSGGRTESTIVSWLSQRALPPVTDIDSAEALETFRSKSRVVLVSYLPSDESVLTAFAEKNRESVVVGRVTSEDVVNSLEGVSTGDTYIYKQFDDGSVKFDGEFTIDELTSFVNGEKFPLIDAIGPENYQDYIERGLPLVWIALNAENEEQLNSVIDMLKPYAIENKGKLSFTYVDNSKYEQHVSNLGMS